MGIKKDKHHIRNAFQAALIKFSRYFKTDDWGLAPIGAQTSRREAQVFYQMKAKRWDMSTECATLSTPHSFLAFSERPS